MKLRISECSAYSRRRRWFRSWESSRMLQESQMNTRLSRGISCILDWLFHSRVQWERSFQVTWTLRHLRSYSRADYAESSASADRTASFSTRKSHESSNQAVAPFKCQSRYRLTIANTHRNWSSGEYLFKYHIRFFYLFDDDGDNANLLYSFLVLS